MNAHVSRLCSVNHCTSPATYQEVGESEYWQFFVHYCDEHHREISLGTPVGPVGLDPTRVQIQARGIEKPIAGGFPPNLSRH
jgi:hypothetical protein